MTPADFKEARRKLGLTQSQLAAILDVAPQTIRKWEAPAGRATARAVAPTAARALGWLLEGFKPPQWPAQRAGRGHEKGPGE